MTKCDQLRTLLVEEAPDNEKMKYYSGLYLIHDAIVCAWLIVCVMFEDDEAYTETDPALKVKVFLFTCNLPFVILRVIAKMLCTSPSTVLL